MVVVSGANSVQQGVQDALLFQGQAAQHTRPLQGKAGSVVKPSSTSASPSQPCSGPRQNTKSSLLVCYPFLLCQLRTRPGNPSAQNIRTQIQGPIPQAEHGSHVLLLGIFPLTDHELLGRGSHPCALVPSTRPGGGLLSSLTLRSPAVIFCSAPAAASVVCRFSSQRCSSRLYSPTI